MSEPIRLMLVNLQALGDAVVLTATVRDLHRAAPGRFEVRIMTKHGTVWENNPYLAKGPKRPGENWKIVQMHYGKQMGRGHKPGATMHFLDGFIDHFNQVAGTRHGVEVKLTEPRPDLHLSEKEKAEPFDGIEPGYWVMMAGGKGDITTKWWDKGRYQKVVDKLRERGVRVVQCGGANLYNPLLKNQHVNLVGKTSSRQFIHVIAHSAGVIGPITSAMHIAAALRKPAVVIAGGRESVNWEAYPDHTYLHTIGRMHCCEHAGCQKATTTQRSTAPCVDFLRPGASDNTIAVARCMHEITSDTVVDAVMRYQREPHDPDRPDHWPRTLENTPPVHLPVFITKGTAHAPEASP